MPADLRLFRNMRVIRFWAVLTVVALLLRLEFHRQWPTLLEAGMYLVFLLLLAASRPLSELFGRLAPGQQRFLVGFVSLMLVAQIWSQPFKTFPFTPWNMYARSAKGQPEFFEYTGVRTDGGEVQLPAHRLFRSQKRFVTWKLHRLTRAMRSDEDVTRRNRAEGEYTELLRAVARRFNEIDPGAPVELVRVTQCTMSRPAAGTPIRVARQTFAEYDVR